MEGKKKPKCKLMRENGNIFNLWGIASRTLKRNGLKDEYEEMGKRIQSSHSYEEALEIIGEYVEITDKNEIEDNNLIM